MGSDEIRKRFLAFFEKRGHAIVPSAPLVPENDPTTLFTTAGMQPLVPYLLGQAHPQGKRIVNVQKCVRTGDIDEVGDSTHLTFFEMLGNWSLGDYFKKEAITWSYEFLTLSDEGLGLNPARLYVTVFEGDENAPRDEESAEVWKSLGIPEDRIYYRGVEDNWWSPGDNGPCGPDTEMFYDITSEGLGDLSPEAFQEADDNQHVVEIWNDVFMEYEKKEGKVVGKLAQRNVDTGAGFERLTAVLQGADNVFETDLFKPLLLAIEGQAHEFNMRSSRIVADHLRAAIFMIADGVEPSNTDRGYVVRRLIRRAVRHMDTLGFADGTLSSFVSLIVEQYGTVYETLRDREEHIMSTLDGEEQKFEATLKKGMKQFEKLAKSDISARDAFDLYQTYGFPIELTSELAEEWGVKVDTDGFIKELERHQELSRSATTGKFKGGLGDHSGATVKLHTAHHLLLAALQEVLGSEVKQRGSNITPERLRIDFAFDRKLTNEEKERVENIVNEKIEAGLSVVRKEMPLKEAEQLGAEMEFGAKYPDTVSVYLIQDEEGNIFSKEFCGGPHVENTSLLGYFRIKKEEASSRGVRRIKAVLE